MNHMPMRFLLPALAACCLALPEANAQTLARVSGIVRSSTGQTVVGAAVKATGQNRNGQSEAVTTADGSFAFPQLAPDTYQIVASAQGYSEAAVIVEVGAGQTRAVEVKLNGLADSTVISVSNDAATAELSSARLSVNVTPIEVAAMPLNGRSYSILTLFAPGAANRGDGGFDKLSFSGQPNSFNRYSFDGIDASSVIDPNPGWFPVVGTQFRLQTSIETVQEFRVDSGLQPAEYGMGAGGQVNLVSKSGASEFHGSIFENFRHNKLAARDFFALTDDSRLRMNQYGAAFGGPIARLLPKDRAFFFAAFEKLSESSRISGQSPAPTPTLLAIMHPYTRQFVLTLPVAHMPDPTSLIGLVDRSGMSRLGEWNASGRLDFNVTDSERIAVRLIQAKQSLDTLDPTTVTPRSLAAYASPSNAMASWTSLHGPVFNEVKLGLNRAPTGLAYNAAQSWMSAVGVMPGSAVPTWIFGGVGRLAGGEFGRSSDYRSRSYSVGDSLSWTGGRHTVRTGFEGRSVRVPLSMVGGTLYAFAIEGFLADAGATVSYMGDVRAEARQNLYAAFVQDEWRVRPNLTVNAGLRYEYYTPVSEASGKTRVFDMSRLAYLPAGSPPYQASKLGFAPRLGLAWAPKALNSKTIVRLGGAVHYSPGALRDFFGPVLNSGTRWTADGLSYPANADAVRAAGMMADDPLGINADSSFRQRVYQWGLSVQQVLPGRFTAQAGYIGSAGRDLLTRRWGNLATGMLPNGFILRQKLGFGEVGYVDGGGSSNYHAMQLQLNRRFTDDFVIGAQYSWSHNITDTQSENSAMQDPTCLRCEKGPADFDMRHSAAVNAFYRVPLGRGSRHLDKGVLGYLLADWTSGAIFNFRTGMPVNVDMDRSGVVFVDSAGRMVSPGTPGAHLAKGTPLGGSRRGSMRPDVVPGVEPYSSDRLLVFNPAAFSIPRLDSYGNLGRNALLGPGFSQLDFQISRGFRFGEQSSLTFRADIYNIANHANFAPPVKLLVNTTPVKDAGTAFGAEQSANFGVIGSTVGRNLGLGTSRQIQLGLRLSF